MASAPGRAVGWRRAEACAVQSGSASASLEGSQTHVFIGD